MKRLLFLSIAGLFLFGGAAFGEGYFPSNISPTGALDWSVHEYTDVLGDIIRTIPSPTPLLGHANLDLCWAEGMLIMFENTTETSSPKFIKIDPANGTIIGEVNFPFTGYVMGGSYDGTGIWVAKWYPSEAIFKVGLDGTLMSQFTPSTGGYSCRSLNVEGEFLWVGANQAANDTKLYKMSMTGTILEEYSTGSVVGWYMGGEIDTEAASGSNLFVIDNVGNLVKRLNVSGGAVTLMDQFGSPVAPGDYAEGLTFDGQYLWHNSAFAYSQVIWCIDDGIEATPLNVEVTLTPFNPPIVLPASGGTFEFNIALTNNEPGPSTFDVWTVATLPNGHEYGPIIGPINLTVAPGVSIDRDRTQAVPFTAPTGAYTYDAYVGMYPGTIWDEDHFDFEKLAVSDGGALVPDWANWGESFDDLTGETAAPIPDEYALYNNYPNPFNPETRIRFALPASGNVILKVYNTLGEEVVTMVDGFLQAGQHEFTFTGQGLSSGLYFYSLQANEFRAVKKMTLLK